MNKYSHNKVSVDYRETCLNQMDDIENLVSENEVLKGTLDKIKSIYAEIHSGKLVPEVELEKNKELDKLLTEK